MEFTISLRDASDAAIFSAVPGVSAHSRRDEKKSLTGEEFALTLIVSLVASASYDGMKAAAFKIMESARRYSIESGQKSDGYVLKFNGLSYRVDVEADLEALTQNIEIAIKSELDERRWKA